MDKNTDLNEKLKSIIEYYGYRNQLKKFNEESFEVIEAVMDLEEQILTCCECGCSGQHTKHEREHLEEEIADALVLLNQFIYYYDLNENNIMDTVYKKTDRAIDRIANKLKIEGVTDESGRD